MKKLTKNALSLALIMTVFGLPLMVGAQWDPATGASSADLSTDGAETVLQNILNTILALLALLAVLGFVISGVMFITAGGNDDRLKSAKAWLLYSIVGIVVALIGYIVVGFISGILA